MLKYFTAIKASGPLACFHWSFSHNSLLKGLLDEKAMHTSCKFCGSVCIVPIFNKARGLHMWNTCTRTQTKDNNFLP